MPTELKIMRIKSLIVCLLLLVSGVFAALPNYTVVWEVRTVGSDTNGGGFVTGSTGTDMSQFDNKNAAGCSSCQSATVNISTTDAVAAGTTTITTATGNISSALVGNIILLSGGSGSLTAAWYQVVTVVGATSFTVDRTVSAGTGITMNIGGALATIQQMSTNMALSAGPGAWVKATANYGLSSTVTLSNGGPNTGFSFINGYTTTRGDNGMATVIGLAGIAGGNSPLLQFSNSPFGMKLQNFILDCDNRNFTRGLRFNTANETAQNVIVQNCSDLSFSFDQPSMCLECTTFNTPSSTAAGSSQLNFQNNNVYVVCIDCQALGSTVNNAIAFNNTAGGYYQGLVVSNFTGTGAIGVSIGTMEDHSLTIINSSFYNITSDAIKYNEGTVDTRPLLFRNIAISNIGGYCINSIGAVTVNAAQNLSDYIACNTTGALGFYNNFPAGAHDITLTTSPFTNGASNDFSLNNTAGGGAGLKQTGFPGVISAGTGYISFGALEPQNTGGGSSTHASGTR